MKIICTIKNYFVNLYQQTERETLKITEMRTAKLYQDIDSFTQELGELEEGQTPTFAIVENGIVSYEGEELEVDDSECYIEEGQEVVLYLLNDGEVYGIPANESSVVHRVIWVDSIEEIDLDNLGVHFTKSSNYTHTGGGSNGVTIKRAVKVTFITSDYEVNEDATELSNEEYPNEEEVVLNFNQDIVVNIVIEIDGEVEVQRGVSANTGERGDEWVKNL